MGIPSSIEYAFFPTPSRYRRMNIARVHKVPTARDAKYKHSVSAMYRDHEEEGRVGCIQLKVVKHCVEMSAS